ncbi:Protein FAM184A [Takifugu flavidus]|uniref:Protein FAM184A n=1 Tax=Takifugu flavidus TaxID=433684 RepID=A0A5C6NN40_9TELE|nr:Protein FAM184A [Takifugu flavidus]
MGMGLAWRSSSVTACVTHLCVSACCYGDGIHGMATGRSLWLARGVPGAFFSRVKSATFVSERPRQAPPTAVEPSRSLSHLNFPLIATAYVPLALQRDATIILPIEGQNQPGGRAGPKRWASVRKWRIGPSVGRRSSSHEGAEPQTSAGFIPSLNGSGSFHCCVFHSLEATEEKFRNRESRHEDLQVIAELKDMVSERETLVKKLVDDKKFYQLELVNRESNFNKVFNASPNVGVINPLIKQKRKNEKTCSSRFSSSPIVRAVEATGVGMGVAGSGSGQPPQPPPLPPAQPSRLEPIPNSPLHHLELNSNKPLPLPTPPTEPKKFLSPPETKESTMDSPDAQQRQEWFAQYFSF